MIKNNREHIELLNRFMRGETSVEEEQALLKWFKEEDSRQMLFQYYSECWKEVSPEKLPAEKQHQMLMEIKNKIHSMEKVNHQKSVRKTFRISSYRWFSYAAIVLLTVGLTWSAINYYHSPSTSPTKDYVVTADKGQRASIILPDGTKVWLNSDTKISYNNRYGEADRRISLSGEAYFEVSKDKEHRFIVTAGAMEVEALGTTFNVKAYEDGDVTTTLFSGKVRASVGQDAVLLSPNQYTIYGPDHRQLLAKNSDNAAYARMWRDNELAFNAETLEKIGADLSRIYNLKVVFTSEGIKKHRFSGVIKSNSLENVFQIISMTAPISYRFRNDSIILSER